MAIPEFTSDLTADWFSNLLSSADTQVRVRSVKTEPIGAGSGMMSVVYRVSLDYEAGSGPKTLIVKLPTEMRQNREIAVQFDNFRREVEFYLQAANQTPMRTAQVYLAETDGPDKFILVLEDLGEWDLGNQIVGCALGEQGTNYRGHEFHFAAEVKEAAANLFDARNASGEPLGDCGAWNGSVAGSFIHLVDRA